MKRPFRVLMIDDQESEFLIFKEAFEEIDWKAELEWTASSSDTLRVLTQRLHQGTPPDLILLDYLHKGSPCLSIIDQIRSLNGYEHQAIIVVSNDLPGETMREECYRRGILKVLRKPFHFEGMIRLIHTFKTIFLAKGDISAGGSSMSELRDIPVEER